MDAEQLRDSILTFSGQLDHSRGGRHPFPHRLSYFYRQHEPFQEKYTSNLRSVYLMQPRIKKNPFLDLFDGPDGGLHVGDRKSTITTLQALYFLNSEFVHQQAAGISKRLPEQDRVQQLYQLIFNRPANVTEMAFAIKYFARGKDEKRWAGYVRSMLGSNEFLFVD